MRTFRLAMVVTLMALGLGACGGASKPPLQPDNDDQQQPAAGDADAAAPAPPK